MGNTPPADVNATSPVHSRGRDVSTNDDEIDVPARMQQLLGICSRGIWWASDSSRRSSGCFAVTRAATTHTKMVMPDRFIPNRRARFGSCLG